MRRLLLSILISLCLGLSQASEVASARIPEERFEHEPKVALVLAGGGAKGLAHIGALKVLEEAGIPIDMVVGNSMGSIVGGLYALGYNAEQLDSIVHATNWINLLLEAPDIDNHLLTAKKMSEVYQLRVSLDPQRHLRQTSRGGIIEGRNITLLLQHLTEGLPNEIQFDQLPRPFACNATEVNTGKVHEFHDGNLVEAMRASMAIPGVFTPVQKDSLLFVDGFVTNNYPVDIARRMGADIIIGVDLVSRVPEKERYSNLMDLVTHMIDISSTGLYQQNIANTDLYIDVDVSEFSSASFGQADIETLLQRGETRARELLPRIEHLRDSLRQAGRSDYTPLPPHEAPNHSVSDDENFNLRQMRRNYLSSSVNLGARFDNDEYASIHMAATVKLPTRHHFMAQLYGRLGQRLKGGISMRHYLLDNSRIALSYYFEHSDLIYYNHGTRAVSLSTHHQRTRLYFAQEWRKVQYTFGTRYDWHHYKDMLVSQSIADMTKDLKKERYFTYFAEAEYNSLNSIYFPIHGSHVQANAELVVNNGLFKFDDRNPLPILSAQWKTAISLFNDHFTLLPHASARVILRGDSYTPRSLLNVLGGMHPGMKISHQMTMAGVADVEILSEDGFACAGIGIQQRMGGNHYLQGAIDGATIASQLDNAFKSDCHTWGLQFGYSYSSMAGPISLIGYWSERTKKTTVLLNIGYCF